MSVDFSETLGGMQLLVAVIFAFLSLRGTSRPVTIKLAAMFTIVALALFSETWGVYFASVFIIATTITDTDFLQNLAAIIRGNKSYFDYRKELASRPPVLGKMEEASSEEISEKSEDEIPAQSDANTIHQNRIVAAAQLALVQFEQRLGVRLERNIRLSNDDVSVEFDGLYQSSTNETDQLFQIYYISKQSSLKFLNSNIGSFIRTLDRYNEITHRKAILNLVMIISSGNIGIDKDAICELKVNLGNADKRITIHPIQVDDLLGLDPTQPI
jgi:hypothetical protein